jgi:hydrogenase expression/formation protein HypE
MGRTALIVIDLQRDVCLSPKRKDRFLGVLPRIQSAIRLFEDSGSPIFYLRMVLRPDSPQLARYEDVYCLTGSSGADIIEELLPLKGPLIDKPGHGAFFGTDLDRRLAEAKVEGVALVGLQAHLCVYETAAQAFARGFSVVVIEDCVLSTDQAEQEHAIAAISKHYGERAPLREVARRMGWSVSGEGRPAPAPGGSGLSLAVGDGLEASARFVRDEILSRFPAQAGGPEDGSLCEIRSGRIVVSTDSFLVEPFFPGGDIGRLAVTGTVNDLLACGAVPRYLTLGLVLREGLPLADLGRVLDSLRDTAREAGVEVVAGDTKVVPRGETTLPIVINTTGIGEPLSAKRYALADARPGDAILITGRIGEHALAVLEQRSRLSLDLASDCAPLGDLLLDLLREEEGVVAMRDPTRGGLLGLLFDLAEASGSEIRVEYDAIPVSPEVKSASDLIGVDPIALANEGKMVLVTRAESALRIRDRLRAHPLGRDAAILGEVAEGKVRVIIAGSPRQYSYRPENIGFPRLC